MQSDHRLQNRYNYIGKSVLRIEGDKAVTGATQYATDRQLQGMLYGRACYSGHVSMELSEINLVKARAVPGVVTILTADDLPAARVWQLQQVLAGETIRFEGDVVALVAAETRAAAEKAARLVEVTGKALPVVEDLDSAMENHVRFFSDAQDNVLPNSHWRVRKGSIHESGDVKLEHTFFTNYVEHMYIEPEAALVIPQPDGLLVYAAVQNPFMAQEAVAAATGYPMNRVEVQQIPIGASFGGKLEGASILAARAAVLAKVLQRPVCMQWSRWESMVCSPKRHPMKLAYTVTADKSGELRSICADINSEGGAYGTMSPYVNWRGVVHACGCYNVPYVSVDICAYYTNRAMSGAFRGFSSPQVIFAQESLMDMLAAKLQISPLNLRIQNALKTGDITATGQTLIQPMAIVEMLKHADLKTDYARKYATYAAISEGRFKRGIGLAVSYRGCGYGAETADATGAHVVIHKDGSVTLRTGLVDIGQGLQTVFTQILAESLGVTINEIRFEHCNTKILPDGNSTSASRGTFRGGKAVMQAGQILKKRLLAYAAHKLSYPLKDLQFRESHFWDKEGNALCSLGDIATEAFYGGVDLSCWYWLPAEGVSWNYEIGQGDAYQSYSCSVVVTELTVDTALGLTEIQGVYACHDSGRIINFINAKGQVTGGISMGIGMALTEQVHFQNGRVQNGTFHDYILPTALDMPPMEIEFWETADENGPYNAKSLGEASSEAVAASVANALANATGCRFFSLPVTPQDILKATMRPQS